MDVVNPSDFGTVTFGAPETVELAPAGYSKKKVTATCAHGEWRPPERLVEFLPDNFSVPIDCYTTADGMRRIVPHNSFEELIDIGAVGGLAVIHGVHGFDKEVDHSYRVMLLIHQHVRGRAYRGARGMKEHIRRNYNYKSDLSVRRLGRLSDDERDVLPDDVGLGADGEGDRLLVDQLTASGRRAAKKAGYRNPTGKQAIPLGLYEAAKLNPVAMDATEVPKLVRMALFNIDHSSHIPPNEVIKIVTERLLKAIHRNLDKPQKEFDTWFTGPSNSLVKQIAKQKLKRGGELPREDVRQALLYLGWQAYEYVGQCINALMRTIKNSMRAPLNDEEKRTFEHMYESQSYYGGLPAALLVERMDFLRPAILAIWEEPQDQKHVHVLHKLMWNYTEMAHKRREADRRSKQRCQPTSHSGDGQNAAGKHYVGSTPLIGDLHSPPVAKGNLFNDVVEHICELRKIECANSCGYREYTPKDKSEELLTFEVRCECGNVDREITVTKEVFEKHKKALSGQRRGQR